MPKNVSTAGEPWILVALDIDGTLIDLAGAGSRAMDLAFSRFLELGAPPKRGSFAGRTDCAMVREVFRAHGRGEADGRGDEGELGSFFDLYLSMIPAELSRTPYRATPGAAELLEHLGGLPHVKVGVATGNIVEAARLKLRSAGLREDFDFGAYGREFHQRDELLGAAFAAGAATLSPGAAWRAVVVGDTPHDIDAAHKIGAVAVAVAQGPYSLEELRSHGPDEAVVELHELIGHPLWRR